MEKLRWAALSLLLLLPAELFAFAICVYGNGRNDRYRFYPVSGTSNLYSAFVNVPGHESATDPYSYWIGNDGDGWDWTNGISKTEVLPASCGGRFVVTIDITSVSPNYSPQFEMEVSIALSTSYLTDADNSFTMYAVVGQGPVSRYEWQSSTTPDDEASWQTFYSGSVSSFQVGRNMFPTTKTYYRVIAETTAGKITSQNIASINIAVSGGGTQLAKVFEETFGTVDNYKKRKPLDGMQGYTFRDFPKKITDGQYALVADPYWCGCGDGGGSNIEQSVEKCTTDAGRTADESLAADNWYRAYIYPSEDKKFRDHTINEQSDDADEYGLCLLINYSDAAGAPTLAYQHQLTEDEKEDMIPGCKVRMTAFVASAAREFSGREVSMTIALQFRPEGQTDESAWKTLVYETQTVHHHDNWLPIITDEFILGSSEQGTTDGDYRLQVYSSGLSGFGNDILLDDIFLEAGQPELGIFFEKDNGQSSQSVRLETEDDSNTLVVPKFDELILGEDPGVLVFVFDPQTGEYRYAGDFAWNEEASRYETEITTSFIDAAGNEQQFFDTVPDEVRLVGVGISNEVFNNSWRKSEIIADIESGKVDPENDSSCFRTETYATMRIRCYGEPVLSLQDGSLESCSEYPVLKLDFDNFANVVSYTLVQNGTNVEAVSGFATPEQIQAGSIMLDLSQYKDVLAWESGNTYEIAIAISETFNGKEVCIRESNVLAFDIFEAETPIVNNYNECSKDGTVLLSDLVTSSYNALKWYDADMQELADATFSASQPGTSTYYVKAVDGHCESELVPVTVTVRPVVLSVDLILSSSEQRGQNLEIGMGESVDEELLLNPYSEQFITVWTANGKPIESIDEYFPAKPYTDQLYKVVVTDECGNTIEATAVAKVIWPTIFTPHTVDGYNDGFLVGMDDDIHLEIYDRYGNIVYNGNDGWHQSEAAQHMPGVYYYIATLPDGGIKKGTVEIYR